MSFARRFSVLAMLLALAAGVSAAPALPHKPVPLSDSDKFTFVAYGDTRSDPPAHRAIIAEIVRLHPEFVLQSGDLVNRGGDAAEWAQFGAITQPLRAAHIAYYPARGNHDVGPYYVNYVREPFDSGNKYYYAFTRHRNRFIIVDNFEDFSPGSAQYRWLEHELAAAQKTALNTFVMFHESPYSVGPHGPTPEPRKYLHPLFVKYHVRAVFNGHDHLYYRTRRDGVTYLVTGGGGAPLYTPTNKQLAVPGDVYAKAHHVILCKVNGRKVIMTVLTVDGVTIPAKQPVTVSVVTPTGVQTRPPARTPQGLVLDQFTLGPQ